MKFSAAAITGGGEAEGTRAGASFCDDVRAEAKASALHRFWIGETQGPDVV